MSNIGDSNSPSEETSKNDEVKSSLRRSQSLATDSTMFNSRLNSNRYNSYNNSSYNANDENSNYGYNSYGNNSYGGYGGYGGYGSGYGNSYGGYGSGYSSYNSTNQYSNQYSKPMPNQTPGNEQMPPPTFRHDVWGFLNGFHAILNVLYAGTGIVHFGKMFIRMSIKIIKIVFGKSAGLFFRLTGFNFLKNIMEKYSGGVNWQNEFNFADAPTPMDNAWDTNPSQGRTFFGKILLVLRIFSLMGAVVTYFLRRKAKNEQPPVQAETHPDIKAQFGDQVNYVGDVEIRNEDAKLVSDDNKQGLNDDEDDDFVIKAMDSEDERSEMNEAMDMKNEEIVMESVFTAEEKKLEGEEEASKEVKEVEEKATEEVQAFEAVQEDSNTVAISLEKEIPQEVKMVPQITPYNSVSTAASESTNVTKMAQENPICEDFWKDENTYKHIQEIQKQQSTKVEETKPFELPSILATLRSSSTPASSSNKPWLLKKKKTIEVQPESTPENKTEEIFPKTVTATLGEISEVPELKNEGENTIERSI